MAKTKEKYLMVVSFLEGRNFPKRIKTNFIIEAKFDGELLTTDPVDHSDLLEINQELAWELDKKSLQLHKLQRSCIKAICYAVGEGFKENIGYIIIDIRSAPFGIGKPKWFPLLQSKYPKSKPIIRVNIYLEGEQLDQENQQINTQFTNELSTLDEKSETEENQNKKPEINLVESEGYYLIDKITPNSKTYTLTITIAFAKNLIRVITNSKHQDPTSSNFHFHYSFLNNSVITKPFSDIVSCQINGEQSSIRLHATFDKLKRFFQHLNNLEITFYSNNQPLAKGFFDWNSFLKLINENESIFENQLSPSISTDFFLQLEPIENNFSPNNSLIKDESNLSVVGLKLELAAESKETHLKQNFIKDSNEKILVKDETPLHTNTPHVIFKNETATILLDNQGKESKISLKTGVPPSSSLTPMTNMSYITEEMQLKAAYELQVWKEAKEKEFEQYLKKLEAKKLQSLAETFKQHDIERELIMQKKIKEYSDLEILLRNSLSEVEKREKQLALNESQIARLKADLHHEYENKFIELREASKRVQEKADHQTNLHKLKCESLEEDITRYKKQITEWEKKFIDKEAEFSRFKEKENMRPEIKLQSELNMLNIEKIELERKLDLMCKAKNHYKEQWTKALQELALNKKREEVNAKALLKKQHQELEHMRLRYLAAEEQDLLKSDQKSLEALKNELEKLKFNSQKSCNDSNNLLSASSTSLNNNYNIDANLQEHINRLKDERDTLLRTGVYSNTDAIIIELDKRIRDCLKENKLQHQQIY